MYRLLRGFLLALATLAVLTLPAREASAQAITGTWVGTASQVGRDGGFVVVLTIDARSAQTNYPGDQCVGNLTRVGTAGNFTYYFEQIVRGRFDPATGKGCVDGAITLARAGPERVVFGWFGVADGAAVVAYADLAPSR
ncbi:MAG: hypothetical protein U1E56_03850 [Bauldia sp.]